MCFSAPVSFVASGVLAGASTHNLTRAKKKERLLALIPLLFSVQQLIEGLQWIVVKPSPASTVLGYGFLFFAFLLWPAYTPLAMFVRETDPKRRSWLKIVTVLGFCMSGFLLLVLLLKPLHISVLGDSLYYDVSVPFTGLAAIAYVTIIAGSTMLSSDRWLRNFGWLLALSAILSWVIVHQTFTSVWCFFAAVLSGLSVLYFHYRRTLPTRQV